MGDWTFCLHCAEPVAPKPDGGDPGCFFGFAVGFALAVWAFLAATSWLLG